MTGIFTKPRSIFGETIAQGVATDGALFEASQRAMRLVDNSNASATALQDSYDDWIGRIYEATGNQLDNPMIVRADTNQRHVLDPREVFNLSMDGKTGGEREGIARQRQDFMDRVFELAQSSPDGPASDWALFDPEQDALRRAGVAEEDLARLTASRTDLWKNAVGFGGAGLGSLNDPFQVATLLVSGGTGAGKTALGRILNVAMKEAIVNGTVEAAMQPMVQDWRAKIGVSSGLQDALANVGMAAGFGGLLGAGFSGLGEGVRALGKGADSAVSPPPDLSNLSEEALGALKGDMDAGVAALTPIREALAPEARGALDAAEAMNSEITLLEHLNAHSDEGVAQYDAYREVAGQAADGDPNALQKLVDQDAAFQVKEPDFSPRVEEGAPAGLDDPFLKTELDNFVARFGNEFDENTLNLPALNQEGDVVTLGDVLADAEIFDTHAALIDACKF